MDDDRAAIDDPEGYQWGRIEPAAPTRESHRAFPDTLGDLDPLTFQFDREDAWSARYTRWSAIATIVLLVIAVALWVLIQVEIIPLA
jgi:hypothetical protein